MDVGSVATGIDDHAERLLDDHAERLLHAGEALGLASRLIVNLRNGPEARSARSSLSEKLKDVEEAILMAHDEVGALLRQGSSRPLDPAAEEPVPSTEPISKEVLALRLNGVLPTSALSSAVLNTIWPIIEPQIEGWRQAERQLCMTSDQMAVLLDELEDAWWLKAARAYDELRQWIPRRRAGRSIPSARGPE